MTEWISIRKKHPPLSNEDNKYFVLVFYEDPNGFCTVTNAMYFYDETNDSYCWKTYCITEREGYFHNISGVQFWAEMPGWIIGEE